MKNIIDIFKQTLKENGVQQCALIAAVSGGADSLCLLRLLSKVQNELSLHITAAHFNHNLRGGESELDQEFVQKICTSWNFECQCQKWLTPQKSEATARTARYMFLSRVAKDKKASFILTGHTQSDMAETLILNLIRGSGCHGLAAWQISTSLTTDAQATLVRPLLTFSAEQTREFCIQQGLEYHQDKSNQNTAFTRNFIRHRIMPLLKEINPRAEDALAKSAALIRSEHQLIVQEAQKRLSVIKKEVSSGFYLHKETFLALPQILQQEILRQSLFDFWGHLKDLENKHIKIMIDAAWAQNGSRFSLPHNTQMTISYDSLRFDFRQENQVLPAVTIGLNEEKEFGDFIFNLRPTTELISQTDSLLLCLKTEERLVIRQPQCGDEILIKVGHKKISDLLGEAKITRDLRRLIPIVTQNNQVVWLVGIRKAWCQLPKDGQIAVLSFTRNQPVRK